MEKPLISVIVPIYKVEAYLDRCVQSIVDQTYQNLEIILVDDGSPDNCPAMCDDWAEKDSRIKVVHKKNGGLSDARNAGMAVVAGELMGFIDSDDWISPDMYQLLYDNITANDSDISVCGVEMVFEDGSPSRMLTKSGACVLSAEDAMRAIIEESRLKQPVWYKLYKTELIRDIPFAVGKYHEDVFWSYQAVGRAQRVSVFDKPCYFYTQRSGSIMGESYSIRRLDSLEAKQARVEYIREKFPALLDLARCDLWFSCMYAEQMILRYGDAALKEQGTKKVKTVLRENPIDMKAAYSLTGKRRMWLMMEKISLIMTCKIRNLSGIGF